MLRPIVFRFYWEWPGFYSLTKKDLWDLWDKGTERVDDLRRMYRTEYQGKELEVSSVEVVRL